MIALSRERIPWLISERWFRSVWRICRKMKISYASTATDALI
jgi:hypothetical protein